MSVDQYILFGSPNDGIITPWKSAFFGQYKGDDLTQIDFWERDDYHQDNFGLKSMHEQGRIKCFISGLKHLEYILPKAEEFLKKTVAPWLQMQR